MPRHAIRQELLRWSLQAKLQKANIGGRIAHVNLPARKNAFVVISGVHIPKRSHAHCKSVLPGPIHKVDTAFSGTSAKAKFLEAPRIDRRGIHDVPIAA